MNKKIIMSLGAIVFVTAVVIRATGAFFNDTETSTGNTFTAGALDLRVDSTAHYNHMICVDGDDEDNFGDTWQPEPGFFSGDIVPADHYPQPGTPCNGTWSESDLIADMPEFRFFNLADVKPGDEGENTISLHVTDNDAWGCFLIDNVSDLDVTCNEPETESTDPECSIDINAPGAGELGAALSFDAWLDEGTIPGFQCNNPDNQNTAGASCEADPQEGDNILNGTEVLFWNDETVDAVSEGPFAMSDILSAAYTAHTCTVATGDTDFGLCHGLAADGRMVGAATYYWGLAWNVPDTAGNEIQTDSLVTDMTFEIVQHRNNPDFSCTVPEVPVVTTLTLAKTVLPAEAGLDSNFTLSANGPTPITGTEGNVNVTAAAVGPGVYTLSESGSPNPGYSPVSTVWNCAGNATPETDNLDGTATVTVGAGESVTCGVTNTFTPTTSIPLNI